MTDFLEKVESESTFVETSQNTSLNIEPIIKDGEQEPTTEAEILCPDEAVASLPALLDTNTVVVIPTDPEQLNKFVMVQQAAVELGKAFLKKPNLPKDVYQTVLANTQLYAEHLLYAELELSKQLKELPKAQGQHKDSDVKTKADLIAEMGLTPKQARAISDLDEACVERAVNMAREYNDIVSRNWAIRMKRKNNQSGEFTNIDYSGKIAECSTHDICIKYDASEPLYYTQLFANVGIGEYYLHKLNVINAVANELIEQRAMWYQEIYPHCNMVQGDFTDDAIFDELVKLHHEKGCKMVLASPVCQPFSKAGKKNYNSAEAKLFLRTLEFIHAVDDSNQFVMIENVPEFLNACPDILIGTQYKNIAEYIKCDLESLGYIVNLGILNAADYGTCQSRERAIITAAKSGLWKFPVPDKRRMMLWECIGDLPSIEAGEDSGIPYHIAERLPECQVEVLKHTPTGCSAHNNQAEWKPKNVDGSFSNSSFKSSFGRKFWDRPCNTITTQSDNLTANRTIHPGRPLSDGTYSDARCLTLLELLRVTGLPDDYSIPTWAGNTLIREVIGEAFMPKLVKRLIEMLPEAN
ncbi:MAG: DNA cytosine methyltransferase [Alphaproteobacteria bacterium]|nr:DNA cytosine methyltransferase [Alphaproteobacteria bacterium]